MRLIIPSQLSREPYLYKVQEQELGMMFPRTVVIPQPIRRLCLQGHWEVVDEEQNVHTGILNTASSLEPYATGMGCNLQCNNVNNVSADEVRPYSLARW